MRKLSKEQVLLLHTQLIKEFGSNENCRIPMRKSAIAEVEKAEK